MNKPSLRLDRKDDKKDDKTLLDAIMGILVLALWALGLAGGLWFLGQ